MFDLVIVKEKEWCNTTKNKQTSNKQIQGRLDGDYTGLQLKVSYYNGLLQKKQND